MNNYFIFAIISINLLYYAKSDLSQEQKDTLLKEHNRVRSEVKAADMVTMFWNETLAKLAQKWSNKCIFEHPTSNDVEYRHIGQNLYQGMSSAESGLNPMRSIIKWEEEKKYFYYPYTCKYSECGHYTQVVYAKASELGCGYTTCKGTDPNFPYEGIVTCQYLPIRKKYEIYAQGAPCSKCSKSEYPGCVNNLCTSSAKAVNSVQTSKGGKLIKTFNFIIFLFLLLQVQQLYCPL